LSFAGPAVIHHRDHENTWNYIEGAWGLGLELECPEKYIRNAGPAVMYVVLAQGHLSTVKGLIAKDAKVDLVTKIGMSVLLSATQKQGFWEAISLELKLIGLQH